MYKYTIDVYNSGISKIIYHNVLYVSKYLEKYALCTHKSIMSSKYNEHYQAIAINRGL